jgi:tRNA threonylcarbamoyladenosine biosynthesis protein TsaB
MGKINILVFDTSSSDLKIALSIDNKKHFINLDKRLIHIENLLPAIHDCFENLGEKKDNIDFVGVCTGPGSFTGLRIGIATALGISYASGLKCFGYSVFDVYQFLLRNETDSVVIPVIDAKKERYYCSLIQHDSKIKMLDIDPVKLLNKIKKIDPEKKIIFAGRDFEQISQYINSSKIKFKRCYPDNFSAEELLEYAEYLLTSDKKINTPKPIYLRKSEAEILLLKNKKLNSLKKRQG